MDRAGASSLGLPLVFIHPSAWKGYSPKFLGTAFQEILGHRPTGGGRRYAIWGMRHARPPSIMVAVGSDAIAVVERLAKEERALCLCSWTTTGTSKG
jgi:hypothetical protein